MNKLVLVVILSILWLFSIVMATTIGEAEGWSTCHKPPARTAAVRKLT